MTAILEKAGKILSNLTVVVILIGYLNLHSYYRFFGITIYNYLDVSEIIFAFIPILENILFALIGFSTFFIGFKVWLEGPGPDPAIVPSESEDIQKEDQRDEREIEAEIQEEVRRQLSRNRVQRILARISMEISLLPGLILFLVVTMGPGLIVGFIYNFPERYKEPLASFILDEGSGAIFVYCILLSIMIMAFFIRRINIKYRFAVALLFFLGSLSVFTVLTNYANAYAILHGRDGKYPIVLKLNDGDDIDSDKGYKFIGSTKNFFFFRKSTANVVIPASDVKREYAFPR